MEFVIGATAACGACIFSNPMDVLKTRMQLQGELKARGQYTIIYRNILHAGIAVAKADGISGLQKGLVPALSYQVVMNGMRFGLYRKILDSGIISRADGSVSSLGCIAAGAFVGVVGGVVGSPFYLVKTHLQSHAAESIAVGHQHKHEGFLSALHKIFNQEGVKGLWRGATTSIPRVGVGSAAQLFSYSKSKDWLDHYGLYSRDSWQSTFVGAMVSGLVIASCMSPFDVVATRVYNQGLDKHGRGLLYKGITDCILKIYKTEGVWGFYKGWSAIYFRIGPHSFLNLIFWDHLQKLFLKVSQIDGEEGEVSTEEPIRVEGIGSPISDGSDRQKVHDSLLPSISLHFDTIRTVPRDAVHQSEEGSDVSPIHQSLG
ncbi:solute carrier family 25 member 35-like isoform X1 [Penaeus chinensis]|uniref:solute carrier family 25 member 35-like isoform X1 n=1 Tax=Penaeus chinensis TaxID=139456 RepID=UPI001FB840D5|nr:solute carrier family 25 member 35-like isoform X1 [Penaeus chinensis]XP_047492225.1 solute carrier family 25 member 35-like isoform X1 [Penaeus chinensis]XP_047492226.1 solute carrier family 25 member 35-like isoform X1 [Penaeus chinensis]